MRTVDRSSAKVENDSDTVLTSSSDELSSRRASELFGEMVVSNIRAARRLRIKKIPLHLRRRRVDFTSEASWAKRFVWKLKEDSQFLRQAVQVAFVVLCFWIGIEFSLFVDWGFSGGEQSFSPRPPGVEGFLPIRALISLKYWLFTGVVNDVHPSGLFILIAIVAVSFVLTKAFCSWLCPVGTLSEALWMLDAKLFGRNIDLPKWLDYPLRSLKYLLLLFFVWSIWQMDVPSLYAFIHSPYNKVAYIKMYLFFAQISTFALWTITILMLLSVVVKNFWCRFLCPYGALLGIVGWLSPMKITRMRSTCIDCELGTKACPANIKAHEATRVWSDECTSCLACVEVCPVKDTLEMKDSKKKRAYPTWVYGLLVVGTFVAITGLAVLTGHWQNKISSEEYQMHFQQMGSYSH
ncbi:MAG: 4Fe-4S binding protein [Bacteroidota bacterium]